MELLNEEVKKRILYTIEVIDSSLQTIKMQRDLIEKLLISFEIVKEENRPENWNYKINSKTLWDIFQEGINVLEQLYSDVNTKTEDKEEIEKFLRDYVRKNSK